MMDPLNLILLAVAVFVVWRLYGVLGSRTGTERPPFDPFGGRTSGPEAAETVGPRRLPRADNDSAEKTEPEEQEPVWKGFAAEGTAIGLGLEAIAGADKGFSPKSFLEGAKFAYEMIIESFAKGDKAALKPLLSKDVFDGFAAEIDGRAAKGHIMETRFVGFRNVELAGAELSGARAAVTVKFVAEMITTTKLAAGDLIDGDPKKVREVTDIWTFERDVTSRDPNWRLASTEEPA